jgi:hypothetical protein
MPPRILDQRNKFLKPKSKIQNKKINKKLIFLFEFTLTKKSLYLRQKTKGKS